MCVEMCVADAVLLFCLLCFQGITLQDENKKRKQQNLVLGPQAGVCIDLSWYAFKIRINQNKQCKVKGLPWWWGAVQVRNSSSSPKCICI